MSIVYLERNGRRYAYKSTSKRVPGKKNPVSERVYLGVVDPETGRIIPKKGEAPEESLLTGPLPVKSYGDVAVAYRCAERIGIVQDLEKVFGQRYRGILAAALAQAVRPSMSDEVYQTLCETYIRELLGLDRRFNRESLKDAINGMTKDEMFEFFRLRGERSPGRMFVVNNPVPLLVDRGDPFRGLYSTRSRDTMTAMFIISESRDLIATAYIKNVIDNPSEIVRVRDIIRGYGFECTYITDAVSGPAMKLDNFIMNGIDFIIPCPISSNQYRSMAGVFNRIPDKGHDYKAAGDLNCLKESSAGILKAEGGYDLVPVDDPRFEDCPNRLRAYLNFDSELNRESIDALGKFMRDVKYRLNGQVADDAEMALVHAAGSLAELFRVSVDKDGRMVVTTRRGTVGKFRENAGKVLILASSASWERIVAARISRHRMTDIVGQFYKGDRWIMKYTGKDVNITCQLFVEYLALLIYGEIQRVMDANGENVSIETAFRWASMLKVIETTNGEVYSEVSRDSGRILSMFDVNKDLPRDFLERIQDGESCD